MILHDLAATVNVVNNSTPANYNPSPSSDIRASHTPPTRELSLIEKKRLQWSREKEDETEWFPFGKPGAGAPLSNSNSRSQKNSFSVPAGSYANNNNSSSDIVEPKDSVSSYNSTRGRFIPVSRSPLAGTAPDSMTPNSAVTYSSPSVIQVQYFSGHVNGSAVPIGYAHQHSPIALSNAQASPIAVPSSTRLPAFFHVQSHTVLPPANSGGGHYPLMSNGNSPLIRPNFDSSFQSGTLPSCSDSTLEQSPPKAYGQYQPFMITTVPIIPGLINSPHPQQRLLLDPAIFVPQHNASTTYMSAADERISGYNNVYPVGAQPMAPPDTGSTQDFSYTEHWTNQLPFWQVSTNSTADHATANSANGIITTTEPLLNDFSTPRFFSRSIPVNSPSVEVPPPPYQTNSINHVTNPFETGITINQSGNVYVASASGSPYYHHHQQQQKLNKIAVGFIAASVPSKPSSSVDTNENYDVTSDTHIVLQKRYSTKLANFGDVLDEKQEKMNQTKIDLDTQIFEKRRKQLQEMQREKMEMERLEHERKEIEARTRLENELERNKWKTFKEEEEKREASVREALEKARLEAKLNRRVKLYRHASQGRPINKVTENNNKDASSSSSNIQSDSGADGTSALFDGFNAARPVLPSVSPNESPILPSSSAPVLIESTNCTTSASPMRPVIDDSLSETKSHCQTVQLTPYSQQEQIGVNPPISSDDRPIKPMSDETLKLLLGDLTMDQSDSDSKRMTQKRGQAMIRQSLRKSRSTAAAKVADDRRAESSERMGKDNNVKNQRKSRERKNLDSQTTSDATSSAEPTSSCKGMTMIDQTPSIPQSRLASAATYVIRRESIFSPKMPENAKELPIAPLKPDKTSDVLPVSSKIVKKAREKLSAAGIAKEKSVGKGSKLRSSQSSLSYLQHNEQNINAADFAMVESIASSDNPWGDQLGGLNPLLQPISTRKKLQRNVLQTGSYSAAPLTTKALSPNSPLPQKDVPAEFTKNTSNKNKEAATSSHISSLTTKSLLSSSHLTKKNSSAELTKNVSQSKDTYATYISSEIPATSDKPPASSKPPSSIETPAINGLLQKIVTRKHTHRNPPQSAAILLPKNQPLSAIFNNNQNTTATALPSSSSSLINKILPKKPLNSSIFSGAAGPVAENFVKFNKTGGASTDDLHSIIKMDCAGSPTELFETNRIGQKYPLCRTFSLRFKQPSEGQSDMLKQLSSLKEQLKKSQKVVEETLLQKDNSTVGRKVHKDSLTKAPVS